MIPLPAGADTEKKTSLIRKEDLNKIKAFNRDCQNWEKRQQAASRPRENAMFSRLLSTYHAADGLSVENARKHYRIIAVLSLSATLLTMAFLLYDEMSLYGLILVCGFLLLSLFFINRVAEHWHYHRKYLEYRLLAEGIRVQYYLMKAGIRKDAAALLPWSWQFNVPWTKTALTLLADQEKDSDLSPLSQEPILDLWIRDQKEYHKNALKKNILRRKTNDRIMTAALFLSILAYLSALAFEIGPGGLFSGEPALDPGSLETVRTILKIVLGTLSAATLFAGNFYGKLSLEDTEQGHRRMIALFEQAEADIIEHGETEDRLLYLAREELSENSSWYACQNKNTPEISI